MQKYLNYCNYCICLAIEKVHCYYWLVFLRFHCIYKLEIMYIVELWLVKALVCHLKKDFYVSDLFFSTSPFARTLKRWSRRKISLFTRFIHLIIVMEIRPEFISLRYRYWLFIFMLLFSYFFSRTSLIYWIVILWIRLGRNRNYMWRDSEDNLIAILISIITWYPNYAREMKKRICPALSFHDKGCSTRSSEIAVRTLVMPCYSI